VEGGTALATTRSGRGVSVEDLSGRQKVAVLCLALGSDIAAQITQRLANDEVDAISFEIARMESISPHVVDGVLEEWLTRIMVADSLASGGLEAAREILEKAFGSKKASQVLERIQGQLHTIGLQRLKHVDARQLATMLRGEHPQSIALILAHLEPHHTAGVLKDLDPALAADVVFRMARMEKVQPELLNLVERSLSADTDLTMQAGLTTSGGPAAVANILNLVPSTLERTLLDNVAERDQGLVDQIRNLMFVFEDIGGLDNRALQRLLRDVDVKQLALALKAASNDLKTKLTSAMSQRAVQALNDEIEMLGPARVRDVEAAQSAIVAIVRQLEDAGEIVVGGGEDDVVL
jgi:flagellar motor switch protein FliG